MYRQTLVIHTHIITSVNDINASIHFKRHQQFHKFSIKVQKIRFCLGGLAAFDASKVNFSRFVCGTLCRLNALGLKFLNE